MKKFLKGTIVALSSIVVLNSYYSNIIYAADINTKKIRS